MPKSVKMFLSTWIRPLAKLQCALIFGARQSMAKVKARPFASTGRLGERQIEYAL
jgi:hypothetical protein